MATQWADIQNLTGDRYIFKTYLNRIPVLLWVEWKPLQTNPCWLHTTSTLSISLSSQIGTNKTSTFHMPLLLLPPFATFSLPFSFPSLWFVQLAVPAFYIPLVTTARPFSFPLQPLSHLNFRPPSLNRLNIPKSTCPRLKMEKATTSMKLHIRARESLERLLHKYWWTVTLHNPIARKTSTDTLYRAVSCTAMPYSLLAKFFK